MNKIKCILTLEFSFMIFVLFISCNEMKRMNDIKNIEKAIEANEKEQERQVLINEVMTATPESVKADLEYSMKKRLESQNSKMESQLQEIGNQLSDMQFSFEIAQPHDSVGASDGGAKKLLELTPLGNSEKTTEGELDEEKNNNLSDE